jgi:hypothetical protein
MYYALADLQCGGLMHTGRNTTSEDELLDHIKSYIEPDIDEEDDFENWALSDICEIWQFEVVTQKTKFNEEF